MILNISFYILNATDSLFLFLEQNLSIYYAAVYKL